MDSGPTNALTGPGVPGPFSLPAANATGNPSANPGPMARPQPSRNPGRNRPPMSVTYAARTHGHPRRPTSARYPARLQGRQQSRPPARRDSRRRRPAAAQALPAPHQTLSDLLRFLSHLTSILIPPVSSLSKALTLFLDQGIFDTRTRNLAAARRRKAGHALHAGEVSSDGMGDHTRPQPWPSRIPTRTSRRLRTGPKNPLTPAGAPQAAPNAGTSPAATAIVADAQIGYRLDEDLPLEWIGDGLRDVGITPGTMMTEQQKPWAYAIMSGQHPNGTVLVAPKMAADPRGKLPARPLLDSIAAAAANAETTLTELLKADHIRNSYARMLRGVERQGDAHTVAYARLVQLADAAGVELSTVYQRADIDRARTYADATVQIGNRGYDITLDLAKSVSVLYAMADPQTAHQLETVYLDSVRETVAVMQNWVAYGMRGHHGDGQRARRIDSTGLLGWMMVHRTARPVQGAPPDPHLHVHVVLANMVHGVDGKWSTVGAGGRDIHRHAHAADAFLKARMRAETHRRWGIQWRRHALTGAWEIAAIPAAVRDLFSKRSVQIDETLARLGLTGKTSPAQTKLAAAVSREAKQPPSPDGQLREQWHTQAREAGFDPDDLAAASLHAPRPGPLPANPTPQDIAAYVFRDEPTVAEAAARGPIRSRHVGLTHNRKVVSRADVLAAVMDALPYGLDTIAEAEALVDQVVAVAGYAIALDKTEPAHLSNNTRYTTAAIVRAEHTILRDARAGLNRAFGVVRTDVQELAVAQFNAATGLLLSGEQKAVLDRLLHGGHQIDAVIGVAGSGKTTLMAALRAAYETAGMRVAGASNSAVAAANLQAESGIPSATIDSWLARADWTNKHGVPMGLRGVRAAQAGPGGTAGVGRFARAIDVLVIDEAATVDDRKLARLLDHAIPRGIKIIGIGDPKQLRAPGVGGTFARVHQIVDGLSMLDNRRQRDETERRALNAFRSGDLHEALAEWSIAGRVHVVADSAAAQLAILARWEQARHQWSDVHDRIAGLLVLTGTNDDAEQINHAIQTVRLATGDLDRGRMLPYRLNGGGTAQFAVGDEVMVRANVRSPDNNIPDLLNGNRGVVTEIDERSGGLVVQWREPAADGPVIRQRMVDPAFIAGGGVSLGYAMTVAKAQGLTAHIAITYGIGLDSHTLYAGMTRARAENHLILPIDMLESEAVRVRLGAARSPEEETRRAVAAYARWLKSVSAEDTLVLDELANNGLAAGLARPDPGGEDQTAGERTQSGAEAVANRVRARQHADRPRARHWQRREYGGLTATELSRALIDAENNLNVERAHAHAAAERHAARLQPALDGHGPAATALAERRHHLEQAEAALRLAEQRMQTARDHAATVEQIRADLARPVPVRLMLGIRTDEAHVRLIRANTLIAHAQQAAELARANSERHAREGGIEPSQIATAVAELRAAWSDFRQAAIDDDVAAVGNRPADRIDLARARVQLSSLRTEQEVRMQQHPEDTAREQRERDTARTIAERERSRQIVAGVRRQWEREVVEGVESQWERDVIHGAERQWEREVSEAEHRRQHEAEAARTHAADQSPDIAT
jgi:conjugative relaxase-like TrwC/TraI family protein